MIGGNISAELKISVPTKNEIGENVNDWTTIHNINGFLDLSSGDSKYTNYNAKIQESTHVFICDYFAMDKRITSENSKLVIEGIVYDVMLIDDPMFLHQHYEIYLKMLGGQNVTS